MTGKAYSVFIGDRALDKDKELLNPLNRTEGIPPDETLISCKYDTELNSAGSCVFVMPPKHPYISEIKPMITEVAVAEIDNIVWFGRVTDTKTDFYNCLEVHCEGAYAYFNDSVQPQETFYNLTPRQYLEKIIANHNAQVSDKRKIYLGSTQSDNRKISDRFRYESTMTALQNFIERYGGYFYVILNKNDERPYLSWVKNVSPASMSTQDVKFGINLLDLKKTVDYADICTAIMPLGADVEMEVPDLDENGNQLYEDEDGEQVSTQDATHTIPSTKIIEVPLNLGMIRDENVEPDENGITPIRFIQSTTDPVTLIMQNAFSGTYGNITRCVTFNEAFDVDTLRALASNWMFNAIEMAIPGARYTVSAADLRFLDDTKGALHIGYRVRVISPLHKLNSSLVITKVKADIVKVDKQITLGQLSEKSMSDIVGRGENRYEVGVKARKISSKKKVKAADSDILFIPV